MNHHPTPRRWRLALAALTLAVAALPALAQTMTQAPPAAPTPLTTLQRDMQVGDLVFIRVKALPFAKVAAATGSWTNHVGVVIDTSGAEPMIGESTFPVSKATNLSRFVARSEGGRVAVMRLDTPLTDAQRDRVTFAHLLERNPSAGLGFWRVWYFGRIPWTRETVTPASLLQSARVHATFDGRVSAGTPLHSSDPAPAAGA